MGYNKVLLVILDGFGLRKDKKYNAPKLAKLPNLNRYMKEYPFKAINASNQDVGLPKGIFGNSEVGHLTIGSGRILKQELALIDDAIKDKSFHKNKIILESMKNAKKGRLHLMGMLSDAGVHSEIKHLFELLKIAKEQKVKEVFIHVITDGRDTETTSGISYIKKLQSFIKKLKLGEIVTITGRYYAMDRDKRWQRTKKFYNLLTQAKGAQYKNPIEAIQASYNKNITDEFVEPCLCTQNKITIKDNDTVIMYNYREDRARQITRAFIEKDFKKFKTKKLKVHYYGMNRYKKTFKGPVFYEQEVPKNTLSHVIARKNLKQYHTAETEKYAHVTFFFNGAVEKPEKGEDRKIIPSPKVATYDLQPKMSAQKVAQSVKDAIKKDKYYFILVNFANPDMVGHTGKLDKAIQAIEFVDKKLGEIQELATKHGYTILITADHGNCDEMFGKHKTTHTLNQVPFIILDKKKKLRISKGGLADIAPTVLEIMKIKQPKEMTGKSLLV